ncbi:hypothetical protein [Occallatibacter riparius]|uniref:Uncharacterized protein n=1 Tax=Occallatibacter riparius TaxID=1002689 RepID=A0A9J7BT53_9BACT|nr:hypothetical protein [Occallatibacter riparius]UWZ84922.1 hypothetical protein MOP44_03040 [Occallatibacter riparius]
MDGNAKVTPKRRQVRLVLLVLAAIVLIAVFWFAPSSKMDTAQRIAREVHDFQYTHNRLPDSLTEIREKEGAVHYQKLDERSFKVWYQANSDEKEVYDSLSNTWFRQP